MITYFVNSTKFRKKEAREKFNGLFYLSKTESKIKQQCRRRKKTNPRKSSRMMTTEKFGHN